MTVQQHSALSIGTGLDGSRVVVGAYPEVQVITSQLRQRYGLTVTEAARLADGQVRVVMAATAPTAAPAPRRPWIRPTAWAVGATAATAALGGLLYGIVQLAIALAPYLAGALVLLGVLAVAGGGRTCTTIVKVTHRH